MKVYVYPVFVVKFEVPDEELDLEGLSRQEADKQRLDWIEEKVDWYSMARSMRSLQGAEYTDWAEEYAYVMTVECLDDENESLLWYNQNMELLEGSK